MARCWRVTELAPPAILTRLFDRVAGRLRTLRARGSRTGPFAKVAEVTARIGYGARGFVYLSVGALALVSVFAAGGQMVGTGGVGYWLAQQPFGRVWLILLGLGLWAFVAWRILQSVFDADREGLSPLALAARAGQALSGLAYGVLAAGVFELLDEVGPGMAATDVAENREKAAILLSLPFGDLMLMAVALVIAGVGIGNIVNGLRSDFAETLSCSPRWCRRLSLMARTGYVARGLAYLPLAFLIGMAGWHARASEVTDMAGSFRTLQAQPGGSIMLVMGAAGLIAFGGFAFIEARFRRIRAPRTLSPLS